MPKYLILIAILFLKPMICSGQYPGLGSWNILNIKYKYDQNLSFFGEAQLRSLGFYDHFHYHEFKAGIDYKLYSNLKLTLGAGKYDTYRQGGNFVEPKNNDEYRLWPQIVLLQAIGGRLTIEQRYRAEFRFAKSGYRNRFRYRFGVSYPFGKGINSEKPFVLSLSNELFFTDTQPYFERNRFCLLFNYKLYKPLTLQIGYLNQFDYKINDETGKNFIILGVFLDFKRKSQSSKQETIEIKDN